MKINSPNSLKGGITLLLGLFIFSGSFFKFLIFYFLIPIILIIGVIKSGFPQFALYTK